MPPVAKHRLDLVVLPAAESPPLSARSVVGRLGPFWEGVDEPKPRFLCNERGGFLVKCPNSGQATSPSFSRGLQAWREGGAREANCVCGQIHELATFVFAPPAGFASSWLRKIDAGDSDLSPFEHDSLRLVWPGFRLIWVRP